MINGDKLSYEVIKHFVTNYSKKYNPAIYSQYIKDINKCNYSNTNLIKILSTTGIYNHIRRHEDLILADMECMHL